MPTDRTATITEAQKRLNESGALPPLNPDGDFGPATYAALVAVLAYQQSEMKRLGQERDETADQLDIVTTDRVDLSNEVDRLNDVVTHLEAQLAAAGTSPVRLATDELNALIEAAGAAFAYHYHRDRMNAISHLGNPKYSPITFALAKALTPAEVSTPELEEVRSHSGRYGLDYGR